MTRTFNPYRTWANDGKALSQWTNTPSVIWQECKTCHHNYNTDEVTFVDDECEECQKKHGASKSKHNEICATARVEIKSNGIVVWQIASESGFTYNVTVFDGRVSSCERSDGEPCNGWRYRHTCHHATLVTERENGRVVQETKDQERARYNYYEMSLGVL